MIAMICLSLESLGQLKEGNIYIYMYIKHIYSCSSVSTWSWLFWKYYHTISLMVNKDLELVVNIMS